MRRRLEALDADKLAGGLRDLIRYAQTGEGAPSTAARVLIEAVQVAADAMRARERLSAGMAIPARWLAALGNVTTTRIRHLIRDGVLRREGRCITFETAMRWLGFQPDNPKAEPPVQTERATPLDDAQRQRPVARPVTEKRLVAVKPSWWDKRAWTPVFQYELAERVQPLLPPGHSLRYDFRETPYFEVPAGTMDHRTIEEWRARVREAMERLDPERGEWTPQFAELAHYR